MKLIGMILLGLFATTSFGSGTPHQVKGFFVSIDGLNPDYAQTLVDRGYLKSPFGFKHLYQSASYSKNARPVITTLTAPSHVSTITCTPPSRHGIVANGFYVGDESVSGFTHEFNTEPLWKAAARQGQKVLSVAYAGADARSERRTADYGIAYPSSKYTSRSQTVVLEPLLETIPTWDIGNEFEIELNPSSGETIKLYARAMESQPNVVLIDRDHNPSNGNETFLTTERISHMYFVEQNTESDLFGYKRNVFGLVLPKTEDGKVQIYISGSSYNNAYPTEYRKFLDDRNLVWPNYGISADVSSSMKIEGQSLIDKFLAEVTVQSTRAFDVDIVLYYQPLIDSIGHKYEGKLPQPFNPDNDDDITSSYLSAYEIIDRNLSKIFAAHPQAVVAVMGDHGMDPIKKIVNLAALLPENVRMGVRGKSSGAQVMLYGSQIADNFNAGDEISAKLQTLTHDGVSVLGAIRDRRDFSTDRQSDYHKEWQYGEADYAFLAGNGYWFKYDPGNEEVFVEPPIYGMHGHPAELETMKTGFFLRIPGKKQKVLDRFELIDAVPTFMGQLGLTPPTDCVGSAIDF